MLVVVAEQQEALTHQMVVELEVLVAEEMAQHILLAHLRALQELHLQVVAEEQATAILHPQTSHLVLLAAVVLV
jgi:hypothetical protein